jgi:hypothetical protein
LHVGSLPPPSIQCDGVYDPPSFVRYLPPMFVQPSIMCARLSTAAQRCCQATPRVSVIRRGSSIQSPRAAWQCHCGLLRAWWGVSRRHWRLCTPHLNGGYKLCIFGFPSFVLLSNDNWNGGPPHSSAHHPLECSRNNTGDDMVFAPIFFCPIRVLFVCDRPRVVRLMVCWVLLVLMCLFVSVRVCPSSVSSPRVTISHMYEIICY